MKKSIIFISALSLVAMTLASCTGVPGAFSSDEAATSGVMPYSNEPPPERSSEERNSIDAGHY